MISLDDIAALDDRALVTDAKNAAAARAAGIDPLRRLVDCPKTPKPQCDVCSEVSQSRCGKCASACYCSRACQVVDWKERGHKAACSTLKARVASDAAHVLKQLWPPTGDPAEQDDTDEHVSYDRVRWASDNMLDNEVAFELAYAGGLNDALRSFFLEDTKKMEARWADNIPCSWTSMAVNSLFRGQRHSRSGTRSFGKADGARCAAYVRSHPEAWPAWLEASIEMARCLFRRAVKRNRAIVPHAHRAARDTWAFLNLALVQRECAEAILVECGHGKKRREEQRRAEKSREEQRRAEERRGEGRRGEKRGEERRREKSGLTVELLRWTLREYTSTGYLVTFL